MLGIKYVIIHQYFNTDQSSFLDFNINTNKSTLRVQTSAKAYMIF